MKPKLLVRFVVLFLLVFQGLIGRGWIFASSEEHWEKKREIKRYRVRNNVDIYLGEGVADIKDNDLSSARLEAEKIAIDSLLRSIKVYVKSDFVSILQVDKKEIEQKIDYIIQTRVESILKGRKIEYYDFYPTNKNVTVLVYVNKMDYDNFLIEEEKKRIEVLKSYAVSGLKNLEIQNPIVALSNFSKGYNLKQEYFKGIPIKFVVGEKEEDVESFFELKIEEVLNSIKFEEPMEKFNYSNSGNLLKKPWVRVYYEKDNHKYYLEGLQVKFSTVSGKPLFIYDSVVSRKDGMIEIPLSSVDPANRETSINVETDLTKYNLDSAYFKPPYILLTLSRTRSVAFAVFMNSQNSNFLLERIKAVINSRGFNPIHYPVSMESEIDGTLDRLIEKNIDYVLLIKLNSDYRKLADYDLYKANVFSTVILYSLPDKSILFMSEGPSGTGFARAGRDATVNAVENIRSKLSDFVKDVLK